MDIDISDLFQTTSMATDTSKEPRNDHVLQREEGRSSPNDMLIPTASTHLPSYQDNFETEANINDEERGSIQINQHPIQAIPKPRNAGRHHFYKRNHFGETELPSPPRRAPTRQPMSPDACFERIPSSSSHLRRSIFCNLGDLLIHLLIIGGIVAIALILPPLVVYIAAPAAVAVYVIGYFVVSGCVTSRASYNETRLPRLPSSLRTRCCDPVFCRAMTKSIRYQDMCDAISLYDNSCPHLFFAVFLYKTPAEKETITALHNNPVPTAQEVHQKLVKFQSKLHLHPIQIDSYCPMSYTPSKANDPSVARILGNGTYLEYRYGFELDDEDLHWVKQTKEELQQFYHQKYSKSPYRGGIHVELLYALENASPVLQITNTTDVSYSMASIVDRSCDSLGFYDKYRLPGLRPRHFGIDYKSCATLPYSQLTTSHDRYISSGWSSSSSTVFSTTRPTFKSACCSPTMFFVWVVLFLHPFFVCCWQLSTKRMSFYHINKLHLGHKYLDEHDPSLESQEG